MLLLFGTDASDRRQSFQRYTDEHLDPSLDPESLSLSLLGLAEAGLAEPLLLRVQLSCQSWFLLVLTIGWLLEYAERNLANISPGIRC